MGCDIHSVAQVKKNGVWETVCLHVAGDDRDYVTFGILAHVRSVPPEGPISEPKGYPADFRSDVNNEHPVPATVAADDYWATRLASEPSIWMGEHSHSWLTLAEIEEYINRVGAPQLNMFSDEWDLLGRVPEIASRLKELAQSHGVASHEDVRYVFGFDS